MPRPAAMNPDATLPTAKVTERAAEGWRKFCAQHDVSYASMLEAIGLWLAEHAEQPLTAMQRDPRWVVEKAQAITIARRSRQPNRDV